MENDCCKKVLSGLLPVFYLTIWFLFIWFAKEVGLFGGITDVTWFLALSFLVMFFGMITKSTSWGVGNKLFNIRGDSTRHIEYSWHENWKDTDAQKTGFTIKIDHDNPEVIERLMDKHAELVRRQTK